jgi:hypothetical protein
MDMNKVKCPHCNNISIVNNNIKICVFKCPCCGKEVTVNNCCKDKCTAVQISNEVYLVMLDIKNCDKELIETRCIAVFTDNKKAEEFADNCDTDKLIEYAYHYSETYVVPMVVDKYKHENEEDAKKALDDLVQFAQESFYNNAMKLRIMQEYN